MYNYTYYYYHVEMRCRNLVIIALLVLVCDDVLSFKSIALLLGCNSGKAGWKRVTTTTSLKVSVQPIVPDLKNVPYRIKDMVSKDQIDSLRLRHIELHSQELAQDIRSMVSTGRADFADLARAMSLCHYSKEKGGDLGWLSVHGDANNRNVFSTLIDAACHMHKGDISVVENEVKSGNEVKSWHVLQLMDVIMKWSPTIVKQRKEFLRQLPAGQRRYSIDTMGCQMNVADSERIEAQLRDLGYMKTESGQESNVVIINTCSIRDHAEQKVYSYIGPHAARKRKGEDVCIMITGCVAQQEGEAIIRRFPEVDVVMGPQYANRMSDLLQSVYDGQQVVAVDPAYQSEDSIPALRKSEVTAYVNVIYGCNERCTYCVVPNTRGVEQSRTKEAIVREVEELVVHGYKEVTLLGQNIDAWGRDMTPKQRFADLLTAVGNVTRLHRLRFLTSHPKYMSERVIRAVASNPKIMPCFNVPFQSGDSNVLKMMRRGYDRERYLEIIRSIRNVIPDAAITGDCIVGFPGETEEQFQQTLTLMEEVKFDQLNSAAYSPRPGTPAALWVNQLPDVVKQDRLQRLNRLGAHHALERSQRFIGRVQEVLVEDVDLRNPQQVFGRNPHSRLVYFEGNLLDLKGQIVQVLITEAKTYSLIGRLISAD